jgi:glycosyltransferase involved in cell wall biosynthesis
VNRLVLHAPNVHVGGGFVLLLDLLAAPGLPLAFANIDARAAARLPIPAGAAINAVRPTPFARLNAELALARNCHDGDLVLCFHGMPPLRRVRGKVVVFEQNRLHLGVDPLSGYSARTMIRLAFERIICRTFRHHVDEYIVQTPAMERAVREWHGGNPATRIIPFVEAQAAPRSADGPAHDFLYVADGEAHKNHRNLLAAWILLAKDGLRPSLALTLEPRFAGLIAEIEAASRSEGLQIHNLGVLPRGRLMQVYRTSRALIFPSRSESFGLPLVEARSSGLPIVASELDFVRDVCEPAQSFDPASPTSIARAVRRFLGVAEANLRIRSGSEFVQELMQQAPIFTPERPTAIPQ